MKQNSEMRDKAFNYFYGNISREDEVILFDYIKSAQKNYNQFKLWEQEWKEERVVSQDIEKEWNKLNTKINIKEIVEPLNPKTRHFTHWKYVAGVAALVVMIISCTLFIDKAIQNTTSETYYTLQAPYGQKSKIVLIDGTIVWLNAGSTLQYSNKFNESNRRVKLTGEGYFNVAKKHGELFTVETSTYDIVVKGTKFNVSAYEEDNFFTTTLIEGSVDLKYKDKTLNMIPGDELSLNRSLGTFSYGKVKAMQSISWKDDMIIYDSISLKELSVKLSRAFNVQIDIQSEELGKKEFRISLRNKETFEEVLEALHKLLPINIEKKGKSTYIVKD